MGPRERSFCFFNNNPFLLQLRLYHCIKSVSFIPSLISKNWVTASNGFGDFLFINRMGYQVDCKHSVTINRSGMQLMPLEKRTLFSGWLKPNCNGYKWRISWNWRWIPKVIFYGSLKLMNDSESKFTSSRLLKPVIIPNIKDYYPLPSA